MPGPLDTYSRYFDLNAKKKKAVPKIIHFIWFGDALPEQYYCNIHNLLSHATLGGYQVNLWTDHVAKQTAVFNTLSASSSLPINILDFKTLRHQFFDYFRHDTVKGYLGDPSESIYKKNHTDKIDARSAALKKESKYINMDVPFAQHIWAGLEKEMQGFKNYAAASDIFRLVVLYLQGGVYLDTDVLLKNVPQATAMAPIEILHDAAIHALPHSVHAKRSFSHICNDIFLAQPESEIILSAMLAWVTTYNVLQAQQLPHMGSKKRELFFTNQNDQRRFGYHKLEFGSHLGSPKRNLTIDLGPGSIDEGLRDWLKINGGLNNQDFNGLFINCLEPGQSRHVSYQHFKLGGLPFHARSDQTWLPKQPRKPRRCSI